MNARAPRRRRDACYTDAVSCWARLLLGDIASIRDEITPMMGADAKAVRDDVYRVVPPLADTAAWSRVMVERDGRDGASGLPIFVLVTGARLRDDLCPDAAEAIEARRGLVTPIDPVR